MKKFRQVSVFISLVVACVSFSRIAFADDCDKYRKLLKSNEYSKIIAEVDSKSSSKCELNILGLAMIDANQKENGFSLLTNLSKEGYPPATYNLTMLIDPNVYDSRQRLILLKEVLNSSFNKKEFQKLFIDSWESGTRLIKSCSKNSNLDCQTLNGDDQLKESFLQIGNNFFEILNSKHITDQTDRKNIEEGILGVISLAAFLSIKSPSAPIRSAPTVASKGIKSSPNAFGTDQKTYLCILGHISSGSSRSVCP